MAKAKLRLIRKTKALLLRLRIHVLVEPIANALLTLVYLSKLSAWIARTPTTGLNDYYTGKRDYAKRYDLYRHVVDTEALNEICYLEFGVAGGLSFGWWREHISHADSRFFGFDTFTGLPEDWGSFAKGAMSTGGAAPALDDPRCTFVKGLFQATLPEFIRRELGSPAPSRRLVVHLDADLYSSTLYVLTSLAPYLKADDILIFDEFNVPAHEFKAFADFTSAYGITYTVIGAVNDYYQVAFKLTREINQPR